MKKCSHTTAHAEKVENDIDWASNRSIDARLRWEILAEITELFTRLSQHAFFSEFFFLIFWFHLRVVIYGMQYLPSKASSRKIRTMDSMRMENVHSKKVVIMSECKHCRRSTTVRSWMCSMRYIDWIFTCTTIWILSPRPCACSTISPLFFYHLWTSLCSPPMRHFGLMTVLVRYVIFVSIKRERKKE